MRDYFIIIGLILHDKAASSLKPQAARKGNEQSFGLCLQARGQDMKRLFLFCIIIAVSPFTRAQSLEDLAARLQVLEDREAIRQLIIDYGTYHDHRDYRSLAALFATNGVWESGMGRGEGPEGVFTLMDETIGHNPLPEGSGTFHVLTNDAITLNGDRASALTKWLFITPGENGAPVIQVLGHYSDEFIREQGVWKFLRREAPVDLPLP